jgi:hypothetical protein
MSADEHYLPLVMSKLGFVAFRVVMLWLISVILGIVTVT